MARSASVIIKTDLSLVRVIAESQVREWTPANAPTDRPPTVREARARANTAGTWVARDPDARRRIEAIYADVDEALCVWMRASSPARPVVAAHLRTMAQEWGDEATVLGVEPLRDEAAPAPKHRRARIRPAADEDEPTAAPEVDGRVESAGFAVIALPDAMVRLLADRIDVTGGRIGTIATVWHLLARAIAPRDAGGITGIAVCDPASPRLIWAWADASGLLAGGSIRLDGESPNDSARRLALDWLTWGAQLGVCPHRMSVWGKDAGIWAGAIGQAWQQVPTDVHESADPIADLARASADQSPPAQSGRWCLARVTRRPTRSTRARYQLTGAALVLVLIAVSSIAFRMSQKTTAWKGEAVEMRKQIAQIVRDTWPEKFAAQPLGANPAEVVGKLAAEELRDFKPFEAPPRPRPIFEEAMRVASILAARITEPAAAVPSILLTQLALDQERGNTLSFHVPDRQTGTELILALNGEGKLVNWERAGQGSDPVQPTLNGTWMKETE